MLYDNIEEWDRVVDGRDIQERGDICISMTDHVDIWQKPTQCFKAIILQLKIIFLSAFLKSIIEFRSLEH